VKIDAEPNRTLQFTASESTLQDVVNFININLPGASAEDSGSELKITSDTKGTGSRVEIVGGTGAATLGMSVGATAGTGDVANIEDVTAAEAKSLIEADTSGITVDIESTYEITIRTDTIGSSGSIQVDSSSTLDGSDYFDLDNSVHSGSDAGAGTMGTCDGLSHGAWANGWQFVVSAASNGDSNYFDVELLDASSIRKGYWRDCITTTTDPDYWQDKINNDASNYYVTVTDSLTGSPPANRPTNGTYTLASGDSGLTSLGNTDYTGSAAGPSGLYELDTIENLRTLIVPGKANSAVHNAMITYCDTRRLRVVQCILDPPAAYTESQIRTYVVTTAALKGASETAWTYWPRMEVVNPRPAVITSDRVSKGVERIDVAMSGHIAGMWAREDNTVGGVYKNHAGTENGILRNVLGPESATMLSDEKHEVDDSRKRALVYGDLINPVRKGSGGVFVDGTKMLKADGNFPRLGQRRGASHIKRTIEAGLPWVPHKRIKKALRDRIDRSVRRFLDGEVAIGAFVSNNPALAYSWSIAESLNSPDVGAGYEVRARLGLAFANPADFLTIELYNDRYAYDESTALAA
jgi:phage tail sheath protein FI